MVKKKVDVAIENKYEIIGGREWLVEELKKVFPEEKFSVYVDEMEGKVTVKARGWWIFGTVVMDWWDSEVFNVYEHESVTDKEIKIVQKILAEMKRRTGINYRIVYHKTVNIKDAVGGVK